jgi:predicted dehydrogenase
MKIHTSRRTFIKQSALATGSLLTLPVVSKSQFFNSSVDDTIRIGLVGCGGRGTGAAIQALTTNHNLKLVAMGDAFRDRLDDSFKKITTESSGAFKAKVDVKDENKFVGFDAYQKVIPLCDVVILATPPGFRPSHFEEAIRQGKHVFMEKPVATDPTGIKKVLETAAIAKQKKLNVVVGLQRHYQSSYRQLYDRVKDGMIGDIISAQAWWNDGGVWVNQRKPGQTEMEYQMRNWYYFTWICGDHIVEQHIHNLDVINWFKGAHPVKAQGMGGREVRKGKDFGEIFDHHYVEFQYPDGSILNSQCRHIKNTFRKVDEQLLGTKGMMFAGEGLIADRNGKPIFQFDKKTDNNPYQRTR